MDWLILSLLTAILWGVAQLFIKKGFASISPLWNAVVGALLYVVMFIPFSFVRGVDFTITPPLFGLVFLGTILYIFFYYALEKGQLALSGTIIFTYPLVTIILSVLFLHESPTVFQIASIFLILLGIVLLSYAPQKRGKKEKIHYSTWLLWALFGAFTTGVSDFLAKVVLLKIATETYLFYYTISYLLGVLIFWLLDKKGRKIEKIELKPLRTTVFGIFLLNVGLLTFYYALSVGNASLVAPVSSSYVALTVLFASLSLHESITKRQWIAIGAVIIGTILIGF